jgi:NAD(P)-dependent dehydrogenase (short-subunit alcohol dehydrogenase family)
MAGLLQGKAGLVTGAAGGIGTDIARAFARAGAAVVLHDLPQKRERAEETVREIEEEGGSALFIGGDVTRAADVEALVSGVLEAFGRLDFANNNAAVEAHGLLVDTEEADFDRVLEVNVKGVWLCLKYELRQMISQGAGAIVNTSSVAGRAGAPGLGAYVASKHGVVGLTRTAAQEAAEHGIRVNAVAPGAVRTPLFEILDEDQKAAILATQAFKRPAEPDEIAPAIVWLCSDQASFITGAVLNIDAGTLAT